MPRTSKSTGGGMGRSGVMVVFPLVLKLAETRLPQAASLQVTKKRLNNLRIFPVHRRRPEKADAQPEEAPERPPSQKARLHIRITPEEEADIVEFTAAHKCLYDKKMRDLSNKSLKDCLWKEQADKMGKPVGEIEIWYDSIRTRLGQLRIEFTERDRWIYDLFQFLCPQIIDVQRRNAFSLKSKTAAAASPPPPPLPKATISMPQPDDEKDVTPVEDQQSPSQQTLEVQTAPHSPSQQVQAQDNPCRR